MTTSFDIPKPTHREVTPARVCRECGCYLRTGNLSTTCDPCGVPPWERLDDDLTLDTIFNVAATFSDTRRPIFDALMDCIEEPA